MLTSFWIDCQFLSFIVYLLPTYFEAKELPCVYIYYLCMWLDNVHVPIWTRWKKDLSLVWIWWLVHMRNNQSLLSLFKWAFFAQNLLRPAWARTNAVFYAYNLLQIWYTCIYIVSSFCLIVLLLIYWFNKFLFFFIC